MLSVICVYNNLRKLEECLIRGLETQKAEYDLVLVDNRENHFANAAVALNYGARQAKGDYLAFLHQDVRLVRSSWLDEVEIAVRDLGKFGVVGVAGVGSNGSVHAFIKDSQGMLWTDSPMCVEVQTVDEVVLIFKSRGEASYFDEKVPGWHAYGVDACMASKLEGRRNYVISAPIWHDSDRVNSTGLTTSHRYLETKYGPLVGPIHTTCGTINRGSLGNIQALGRYYVHGVQKVLGLKPRFFWHTMATITASYDHIECFYGAKGYGTFVTESFLQFPLGRGPQNIIHHFEDGADPGSSTAECLVFETPLALQTIEHDSLVERLLASHDLIFCLYEDEFRKIYDQIRARFSIKVHRTFRGYSEGSSPTMYLVKLYASHK